MTASTHVCPLWAELDMMVVTGGSGLLQLRQCDHKPERSRLSRRCFLSAATLTITCRRNDVGADYSRNAPGPASLGSMRPGSITRFLRRSSESLWLRPAVYAGVAVATLVLAPMVARFVPDSLVELIGLDGVYDLLNALANTLLAVAIFSLGIMASSIQAAASAATPRARPLLMTDRTAQNAISTFIGGFIYSIVGIVGLSTSYYNDASRVILFLASCFVISAVIYSLIRWIGSLSSLGDIAEVVDRLEAVTTTAIDRFAADPYFGGMRGNGLPDFGYDIFPRETGYVRAIDGETLGDASDGLAGQTYLVARVGDWVDPSRPLLRCDTLPDERLTDRLRGAFSMGPDRTFDDDPRYGLVVLSEVAVRALSTGENDPGTALDVITTAVRAMVHWSDSMDANPQVRHSRFIAQPIEASELFEDAFRWIARDGAALLEVQLRLQDAFAALAAHDPARFGAAARGLAAEALNRAALAMRLGSDIEQLHRQSRRLGLVET